MPNKDNCRSTGTGWYIFSDLSVSFVKTIIMNTDFAPIFFKVTRLTGGLRQVFNLFSALVPLWETRIVIPLPLSARE